MATGVITKFDVGDKVWYVKSVSRRTDACPSCGVRKQQTIYSAFCGTIIRINVVILSTTQTVEYVIDDINNIRDSDWIFEKEVFLTKEEADAKAEELNNELSEER